jgi:hypothetical protein
MSKNQRDREGKEPFTHEEVLLKLKRIRDGAIIWMAECVKTASSRGIGSACTALENAMRNIERIESRTGAGTIDTTIEWPEYKPDTTEPN